MAKVNIAKILVPKACTRVLHEDDTVRQGLETMAFHGFTTIPVLDKEERYIGSVTEGDFLRHLLAKGNTEMHYHEQFRVGDIIRKDFYRSLPITANTDLVIQIIRFQNYIPIVDDRDVLCGLLTRKGVIEELAEIEA